MRTLSSSALRIGIMALLFSHAALALAKGNDYLLTRTAPGTVTFRGVINERTAAHLLLEMDKGVSTLVITSPGGDAAVGMELGRAIRQRGIAVTVEGYCVSSCANYLFLASPRKSLRPSSFLGFHGAMTANLSERKEAELGTTSTSENFLTQQLESMAVLLSHKCGRAFAVRRSFAF